MAMNLTGISNVNEFYTDHYLAAILENDLKEPEITSAALMATGKTMDVIAKESE